MGRPSEYEPETAAEICEHIANGMTLRSIGALEGMPRVSTIFKWLSKYPEFAEQYARAKEDQLQAMADEIADIADDGSNDYMERFDKDGKSLGYFLNGEHVQRSKLRIESRKWLLSKLAPKKYGDALTLKGDESAPLAHKDVTPAGDRAALEHFTRNYAKRAATYTQEQIDNGEDLV